MKVTAATDRCWPSSRPTSEPRPVMTCSTPSGRPASALSSARRSDETDVWRAGLSTTLFPATRAGASLSIAKLRGKFHGVIAATTPIGSRVTSAKACSSPRGDSSISLSASSPYQRRVLAVDATSTSRASLTGLPISRDTNSPNSSAFASMRSAQRWRTLPRSVGAMRDQRPLSKAARAVFTTRSTSAAEALGTAVKTSPNQGSSRPRVSPEEDGDDVPPSHIPKDVGTAAPRRRQSVV